MNAILFQRLNEFRKDPTSIVDTLLKRRDRYIQADGKLFLCSQFFEKKLMRIKEGGQPKKRIQSLIGILYGQVTQQLHTLQPFQKLDILAYQICEGMQKQMSKENNIQMKGNTNQILRNVLQNDQQYSYPDRVICLTSLTFDEENEPLANLLVDDDNLQRSNRKVLLRPDLKYLGLHSLPVSRQKSLRITVYLFTTRIVRK